MSSRPVACLLLATLLLMGSPAAGVASVRLAIIAEDPRISLAADLLTVELSKNNHLELLERSQITKVIKEHSLAASHGQDYLKLGELLGADGVLILEVIEKQRWSPGRSPARSVVSARLGAVKPGVVLDLVEYELPLADAAQWGKLLVRRFEPLFPKLEVLAKDAVPISILNVRSAVKTAAGETFERELSFSLLRRLVHEKEIFVLERHKLQTSADEKQFKFSEDSPFWNGSYLLEATIDKEGYQKETLTISTRLTPPGKQPPLNIEITSARGVTAQALAEKLASEILLALRKQSQNHDWKPEDEASRYFEEAKWAWRWRMVPEAQAAAESAWALGRRDLDCASVTVNANLALAAVGPLGDYLGSIPDPVLNKWVLMGPDAKTIRFAILALEAYDEFSRLLPSDDSKTGQAWQALGIQALEAASRVLALFYWFSDQKASAANELTELRTLARSVAGRISNLPSTRDMYWVDHSITNHDEIVRRFTKANILTCELESGYLWADTPEEGINLYRDLVQSAFFPYLLPRLASRPASNTNIITPAVVGAWLSNTPAALPPGTANIGLPPRLVAWNTDDDARLPVAWRRFVQELDDSTNLVSRIEAKVFRLVDASDEGREELEALSTTLLAVTCRTLTNRPQLRYLQWAGVADLRRDEEEFLHNDEERRRARSAYVHRIEALRSEYNHRLEALDAEAEAIGAAAMFAKQKDYLKCMTISSLTEFWHTFPFRQYSKAEAAEMLPLVTAYKSNLVVRAATMTGISKANVLGLVPSVANFEVHLNRAIDPNWQAVAVRTNTIRHPQGVPLVKQSKQASPPKIVQPRVEPGKDLSAAIHFHPLPERTLRGYPDLRAFAHRVREEKLWLELRYHTDNARGAVAAWDPKNDAWTVIPYSLENPEASHALLGAESGFYFEVFKDALYTSERAFGIKKYDLKSKRGRWEMLPIPVEKPTQLFAIGDHLYATDRESIFEILDGGHSTRLLASCRRRPLVTALDSLDDFGPSIFSPGPTLFPGPAGSVRTQIGGKIFSWDGRDWQQTWAQSLGLAEVFDDSTFFRSWSDSGEPSFSLLAHEQTIPELCWREERKNPYAFSFPSAKIPPQSKPGEPLPAWRTMPDISLRDAAVLPIKSNLYFITTSITETNRVWRPDRYSIPYVTKLVCLDRERYWPLFLPFSVGAQLDLLSNEKPRNSLFWMDKVGGFIVIGQWHRRGVSAISESDFAEAVAGEKERQRLASLADPALVQNEKALEARYDRNHDGILDSEERRAMEKFLEYEWGRKLIKENQLDAQVKDILTQFDRNGDGKLDRNELKLMKTGGFLNQLPAARSGQNILMGSLLSRDFLSPDALLRIYDANKDGALDAKELNALAHDIQERK